MLFMVGGLVTQIYVLYVEMLRKLLIISFENVLSLISFGLSSLPIISMILLKVCVLQNGWKKIVATILMMRELNGVPYLLLPSGHYGSSEIREFTKGFLFLFSKPKSSFTPRLENSSMFVIRMGEILTRRPFLLIGPPPPEGYIKLNTDGSALSNPGQTGAGGVFRDHMGNWLLGFMRNVGYSTVLTAELWAIRDGLKLAVERGFTRIIVETDSRVAHILLNSNNYQFHSLAALLNDCRMLVFQLQDVQIKHIYREANMVAANLAKTGCSLTCPFVILDQCTNDTRMLLYSDIIGNPVPRSVPTF
ncbi:hypothetical protein SLA2020_069770 [Shorea laevis]